MQDLVKIKNKSSYFENLTAIHDWKVKSGTSLPLSPDSVRRTKPQIYCRIPSAALSLLHNFETWRTRSSCSSHTSSKFFTATAALKPSTRNYSIKDVSVHCMAHSVTRKPCTANRRACQAFLRLPLLQIVGSVTCGPVNTPDVWENM